MSAVDKEATTAAAVAGEHGGIVAALEAGLTDLRREIDALPELRVAGEDGGTAAAPAPITPLQVISRQGRLILKLSAAAESLDARYKELSERQRAQEARLEAAEEEARAAKRQARQAALEAIRLMDALDWVQEALTARGLPLAADVASAQRDCLGRLAALGLTEVPAGGLMDGRLHEGLEAVETDAVPQYHIVRVLRRGWQMGPDVLRRAGVVTAA